MCGLINSTYEKIRDRVISNHLWLHAGQNGTFILWIVVMVWGILSNNAITKL